MIKMFSLQAARMSYALLALAAISAIVSTKAAGVVVVDAPSPSPSPSGPLNLTEILSKGTQYNAFVRLLKDTEVTSQVSSLLDSGRNADGLTVLAPTDAAFAGLRPGTLNRMDAQAQSQMVLFHILPKFFTFVSFQITTNPVRTLASGQHGVYTVNVTSGGERQQVSVSSGLMEATLAKTLYSAYPLAVYSVDKVLLSPALFGHSDVKDDDGAKAPAAASKPQRQVPSSTAAGDQAHANEADTKRTRWLAFAATAPAVMLSLLSC